MIRANKDFLKNIYLFQTKIANYLNPIRLKILKASFTVLVVTLFLTEGFSQSKDVFFEIPNGKIKFYLNYTGDVTLKSRAYFYRLTQFEANRFSYQDSLSDFYKNGTLAFKQHFKDGLFDGEQIQYYKDGSIHHKGEFRANQKSGRWIYYYNNGQVEKEIEYVGKTPRLINNFSKKGKVYVKDGNGKFRGTVVVGYKSFNEFKLKGKVKDGYKDGYWGAPRLKHHPSLYIWEAL